MVLGVLAGPQPWLSLALVAQLNGSVALADTCWILPALGFLLPRCTDTTAALTMTATK